MSRPMDRQFTILEFETNDPGNPFTWPSRRKLFIVFIGVLLVLNSTIGSSISSGASDFLAKDFHVTSKEQLVLPNSLFLLGYVFGPPLFSPLSESFGRSLLLQLCFAGFTIFTLASALAPSWASLIGFRFLTGMFASAPISVVSGIYTDMYNDPVKRGRAVATLVGSTTIGPVLGPVVSGFVSPVSWRWTFWIALIVAGASWPAVIFLPETYAPVILARRARAIRKNNPDSPVFSSLELEEKTAKEVIVVSLTRPIRLFAEPIILLSCTYIAFEYALFYMFFVAYPIIFQGIYGMSVGIAALPLLPVGIGAAFAVFLSVIYDGILRRATERNEAWAQDREYRRLPLACIGGPIHVVALFWLGWTARFDIHWIVPTLAGLPFGIGIELTFISLLNYVTDAYGIYSASAMASSTFSRSIFAVLLPLGADKMFTQLGVAWATSLLGFVSLLVAVVPFLFIRYGHIIRNKSKLSQKLSNPRFGQDTELEETG